MAGSLGRFAVALVFGALAVGAAVVFGTDKFWAGLLNTGFAGRDTSRLGASRIWLNCGLCGMTQYGREHSPASASAVTG